MLNNTCELCHKKMKKFHKNKDGLFTCWDCSRKSYRIEPAGGGNKPISFKDAMNKTYEVKGYKQTTKAGSRYIQGSCNFPSILIGHKFKIVLMDKK